MLVRNNLPENEAQRSQRIKELANKLPIIQIKAMLVKKGWKKEQLDYIFNKLGKE